MLFSIIVIITYFEVKIDELQKYLNHLSYSIIINSYTNMLISNYYFVKGKLLLLPHFKKTWWSGKTYVSFLE